MNKRKFKKYWLLLAITLIFVSSVLAQTTAFSYQGRLNESGNPVTGTRFFRFTLYDENGAAIPGASFEQVLTVTNGVFNATLDFGANAFPGTNRSLEIAVKINAGDAYTVLNPRQNILSAPYSIKSKTADNATQLGGLNASRYVQQDAGGNVSVGGNLTVSGAVTYNTVNAQTQYNLSGSRFITQNAAQGNLALGFNSGNVNAAGVSYTAFFGTNAGTFNSAPYNAFFGADAGYSNTSGENNSFFGSLSGRVNTTGGSNSFFGAFTGYSNTTGNNNSFFGNEAGVFNTTGGENSFFGVEAGKSNATGFGNSFFGRGAGRFTTESQNSFFGNLAGYNNTTGFNNSFFGKDAGFSNTTGIQNAFFGVQAGRNNLTASANSFFGTFAGAGTSTGGNNSFFGNGSGSLNTTGRFNSFFGAFAGVNNSVADGNSFFGFNAGLSNTTGANNTVIGTNADVSVNNLNFAAAFGSNSVVNSSDTIVLGKIAGTYNGVARPADTVQVPGNLNITGNLTGNFTIPASKITGVLGIPNGGTGLSSSGGAGNFLRSNGATWTSSPILAADIPNGAVVRSLNNLTDNVTLAAGANITITPSGNTLTIASTGGGGSVNAILNQTTPQTNANFNIDGNGTVGGTLTANSVQATGNSFVMGNFGIGTNAPAARLDVRGGNILLDTPGSGVILKSPDGNTCRLLAIDASGAIALTTVTCP